MPVTPLFGAFAIVGTLPYAVSCIADGFLARCLSAVVAVPASKPMSALAADTPFAIVMLSAAIIGHDIVLVILADVLPYRNLHFFGKIKFRHAPLAVFPVSRHDDAVAVGKECLALSQYRIVWDFRITQMAHGIERIYENDMRKFNGKRPCDFLGRLSVFYFHAGVGMRDINHVHVR